MSSYKMDTQTGAKPMIDRSEVNRALAQSLAFQACGKQAEAQLWAARLVLLLQQGRILTQDMADAALLAELAD